MSLISPVPLLVRRIEPIMAGSSVRFVFRIIRRDADGEDVDRDYTGASGTYTFVPKRGDRFTRSLQLDGDPAVQPQMYAFLEPADTIELEAPQRCELRLFITTEALAVDAPVVYFDLLPSYGSL